MYTNVSVYMCVLFGHICCCTHQPPKRAWYIKIAFVGERHKFDGVKTRRAGKWVLNIVSITLRARGFDEGLVRLQDRGCVVSWQVHAYI